MKTNILNEKAEKIKSTIKGTAEKSKEAIREFIASNTKHMDEALDSNKKIFDSIKNKLDQQEIEDTVTETIKHSYGKSIELAEDALDSIINSYTRQMELHVDFNTQLIDAIKESKSENPEKMLTLIHDNFEVSRQLTINNTKEILEFYNKHTNLAVNFNKKFGKNIEAQLDSLLAIQNKGVNTFTDWASDWWKHQSDN